MLHTESDKCCQNCEFLRIDNYCLVKDKYILTKEIWKKVNCNNFATKDVCFSENIIAEKKSRLEQIKTLLLNTPNISSIEE
jgi:hypothetical protein